MSEIDIHDVPAEHNRACIVLRDASDERHIPDRLLA